MVWAFGVAAGIGLLAGLMSLRVAFLVIASFLTVVAAAVLMPAAWWPLWAVGCIVALLCTLQGAYLAGYLVACAFSRLMGETEEKHSVRERLNAALFGGWLPGADSLRWL
jgi:hypothetical protein